MKILSDLRSLSHFLLCFLPCLIGIWLADYALLNDDVAGILVMDEHLLKGDHLYTDFVDLQFPLIDYLMMIPLEIHRLSGIPLPESFFLFSFLLLQTCVLFGWRIAQHNPLCKTKEESYVILFSLYFILFILPLRGEGHFSNFGQREHLFCALVLPYIMLAINRLSGVEGTRNEQIIAGILGVISFSIKPQFILIFVLTELFLMVVRRQIFAWIRTDALIIIILSFLYYVWFLLFMPEYLALISKFVNFSKGYQSSLDKVFLLSAVTLFLPAAITGAMRQSPHIRIFLLLLLLIMGGECIFAVPRLFYYYHLFPVFFFSFLLFIFAALLSQNMWEIVIVLFVVNMYAQFAPPLEYHPQTLTDKRDEVLSEAKTLSKYKTVCFFDINHSAYFPLVLYADDYWDLNVISLNYLLPIYPRDVVRSKNFAYHTPETMTEDERFFYKKVIRDMQRLPPDAIVVNQASAFDYLYYFKQDPRFRDLWSHYEFAERLPSRAYYAVYKRKD